MRKREGRISRTVSMPANLYVEIDNRADAAGLNFSEKLTQLLRKGIVFEDKYQSVSVIEAQREIKP